LAKQARTLFVTDFLECRNSHAIELFFHFSEEWELECLAGDYFGARNGGKDIASGVDSGPPVGCTAGSTGHSRDGVAHVRASKCYVAPSCRNRQSVDRHSLSAR
jgi:hypothetical protein